MKPTVGFIGLGLMGRPMAANLLKAGYEVTVWNRTASRADTLVEQGAKRAATPRDVAAASEVICTIVSDPPALESVLWGEAGVFTGLRKGSVMVESSTVSPGLEKRAAAAAAALGCEFLDPNKFIQTPQVIVILQEADGGQRQIFTDGRKHTADPQPTWMGYSVGTWEGDSLAVDTVGFNDRGWLDGSGHPHSEALHIQERYRRRDFGHMDVQVTLDDPKMYTRPFSIKYTLDLVPDSELAEYVCDENERDRSHLRK